MQSEVEVRMSETAIPGPAALTRLTPRIASTSPFLRAARQAASLSFRKYLTR